MWTLVAFLGPTLALGLTSAYYYVMANRALTRAEVLESALATSNRLLSRALARATDAEAALAAAHSREADLVAAQVAAAHGDPSALAELLNALGSRAGAPGVPVRP